MGLALRPLRALRKSVMSLLRRARNFVAIVTGTALLLFVLDRLLLNDEDDSLDDAEV